MWNITNEISSKHEAVQNKKRVPPLAGGEIFNPEAKVYAPNHECDRCLPNTENLWLDERSGSSEDLSNEPEEFDAQEIFDLLRHMNDPELPSTLEELRVLVRENIGVEGNNVRVLFTPTTPHCGAAHIIGLAIRVRLDRCLPPRFRVFISFTPGSYNSIDAMTKQLNDKERVAAAMEMETLHNVIEECMP